MCAFLVIIEACTAISHMRDLVLYIVETEVIGAKVQLEHCCRWSLNVLWTRKQSQRCILE